MNVLNYQQKIAIMRVLLDIIGADGRIHEREVAYFNLLHKELGLDESAIKDVNDKGSLLALAQIKSFDKEQKEYLAQLMNNMSIVDEDVNVNEVAIYDLVCEFAKIEREFEGI